MKLTGENRQLGEKPVPVPLCPPQISHGLYLGSNPGLRGERPATNRLSHGTATHMHLDFIRLLYNTVRDANSLCLSLSIVQHRRHVVCWPVCVYALSRNDMFCCCSAKSKHLDTAVSPPHASRDMSNNCWQLTLLAFTLNPCFSNNWLVFFCTKYLQRFCVFWMSARTYRHSTQHNTKKNCVVVC
jgi:hypothetical protein